MMSFYAVAEKDKEHHQKVQEERAKQFDKLMQQLEKRKKGKGSVKDVSVKVESEIADTDRDAQSEIQDNYDGFGVDLFSNQFPPSENKILDKTFLGEVKAVEVKDSDDEDYF